MPEVRARVEELLSAQTDAEKFFNEIAPLVTAPPGQTEPAGNRRDRPVPVVPRGMSVLTEGPGTRIGRYKLLQRIGEGGCGVVYMAEQEEPVRRRVALKIIKLGMDTKSVIARFEAERQALAMMDHPNIARVLDAGATETGRPYFVMELVRGDQNHRLLRPEPVSTPASGWICSSRFATPSSTPIKKESFTATSSRRTFWSRLHDGVPVPKVIDFGIAKAIESEV